MMTEELWDAVARGCEEDVAALLLRGVDLSDERADGRTVVAGAAFVGHVGILKVRGGKGWKGGREEGLRGGSRCCWMQRGM